jgi:hypothetical protein
VGQPLLGAVGPEAAGGGEDLGGGVEAELGEGLATELDLDSGDIRPGSMSITPDLEPPVASLGGHVEGLVVDAAGDRSSPARSEVEATAALRLLVRAAGVGPTDITLPVVSVEREALDIGVEVEATHPEAELRAQRPEQVLEGGHGLGRTDGMDELGTGLDPQGREERTRGGPDASEGMIEAVAVLAPAMRRQRELEGSDLDGDSQVEVFGAGTAFLEVIEVAGQQFSPSRQVEGVDP